MRRADALSLARTLMAAGARVQDRPAVIPDTRGGLGLAACNMDWPETAPRTDSPVRFSWHFDAHNGGKVQAWTEPYSWEV